MVRTENMPSSARSRRNQQIIADYLHEQKQNRSVSATAPKQPTNKKV